MCRSGAGVRWGERPEPGAGGVPLRSLAPDAARGRDEEDLPGSPGDDPARPSRRAGRRRREVRLDARAVPGARPGEHRAARTLRRSDLRAAPRAAALRAGVARWVLQRFFARGVKASLRGATAELQRVGRRPAREPRACEGDRPLVRGPPTMGEAGISAHISPCVSPPPGQTQSLRQAADAWHGATGIGETSTWRKREAARWITTVDTEARRFGLRSSVSATAPRRWCRGSSSTAPPPKTGSSPV